ncbi:MAG: matrixin family metalloprotease [Proteobacteria bacterium]|nr:matrixin family metalloprotease [Pseudomonadota bacterium]
MKRLIFTLAALSLPVSAMAWKHTEEAWTTDDFPLKYWVADDGTAETDCEESVPPGYCATVAQQGYAAWHDAQCADFTDEYMGVCENVGYSPNNADRKNYFAFNDPGDDLKEAGTLAAALTLATGTAFILDGVPYKHSYDSDIVFNDNVKYTTHEEVLAGNCSNAFNMRTVITHEIGHTLGMGHSCEEGETCLDSDLYNATMEWTEGQCGVDAADINSDDIQGITALYGPYATFSCSHELKPGSSSTQAIGIVCEEGSADCDPFKLKCVVESTAYDELIADSAEWDWGDGETSSGLTPSHVYDTPGNYTVRAKFVGERTGCGEWDYTYRKVGYVTACGVPKSAFDIEHVDGLTYRLLNETDISVYGCIFDIQWDIFDGGTLVDSIKAWEPEYTFEEPGEYRIVLNVGGYAGTGASEMTFEAKRRRGDGRGCSTVGLGAGAMGTLLVGLFGVARRRW